MATPFIRAKAKDSTDALDNLTAYLDSTTRSEIAEYMASTLEDIQQVLTHASDKGIDPAVAYRAFADKFNEYWNAPAD